MRTEIVYEDEDILVCYKPAGLAVQAGRVGQADMVSELKNYLAGRQRTVPQGAGQQRAGKQTGGAPYLGLVHRLDQPVEGLLVFGKTKKAAGELSAQLGTGILNKQYYAVICGQPDEKSGELVDYLCKTADHRARVVTDRKEREETGAKRGVLQYRMLESREVLANGVEHLISLMEIHIDTGRFHQIRAQMAYAGFPLLGDRKYGDVGALALSAELGISNAALCAFQAAFQHPVTHKKMSFTAKPRGKAFSFFTNMEFIGDVIIEK